jgi:hypothetical protein
MKELVFNFPRYEPEIKKYSNRHTSMSMFYEFLKSILLGELKKKYTTTSNTSIKSEAGVPNNIITPTITQNVRINDKDEFDNLMSEYFDEQSDLNQLNKLIDNDKSINKDIFRRQLITDFLEFKNAAEEYSKTINNDETTIYSFYEFLKQFLINKK